MARGFAESRTSAVGTGHLGAEALKRPPQGIVRLRPEAAQFVDDPDEGRIEPLRGTAPVEHHAADVFGEFAPGGRERKARGLRKAHQLRPVGARHRTPTLKGGALQARGRIAQDALQGKVRTHAGAAARGTAPDGAVGGEEPGFQGPHGEVALGAGVARREGVLGVAVHLGRDDAAARNFGGALEALREPLAHVGLHPQAVDDDVGDLGAFELPGERRTLQHDDLTVDAEAREALHEERLDFAADVLLAAPHDRGEHHEAHAFRERERAVYHRRHGVGAKRKTVGRAVGRPGARKKEAQVVRQFGRRADGRARIAPRALLVDRNRGREPFDRLDFGARHQLQELPRIDREALDVAALPLGIERVERKRTLPRARKPRDDDELPARQIDVDVLEIVRGGAPDRNDVHGLTLTLRLNAKFLL